MSAIIIAAAASPRAEKEFCCFVDIDVDVVVDPNEVSAGDPHIR